MQGGDAQVAVMPIHPLSSKLLHKFELRSSARAFSNSTCNKTIWFNFKLVQLILDRQHILSLSVPPGHASCGRLPHPACPPASLLSSPPAPPAWRSRQSWCPPATRQRKTCPKSPADADSAAEEQHLGEAAADDAGATAAAATARNTVSFILSPNVRIKYQFQTLTVPLPLLILLLILLVLLPVLSRPIGRLSRTTRAAPWVWTTTLVAVSSSWIQQNIDFSWLKMNIIRQQRKSTTYPQHCLWLACRCGQERSRGPHLHSFHPWSCSLPRTPWLAFLPVRTSHSCSSLQSAAPPRCWTGWTQSPCWNRSRPAPLGRRSLLIQRERIASQNNWEGTRVLSYR